MSVTNRPIEHEQGDTRASKDRRGELLAAAAKVFAEKGVANTKVSDIVKVAGVAQGTFYLYFHNKADILHQLVGGCCGDIVGRMKTATDERAKYASPAALRLHNIAFLSQLFEALETEHESLRLVLGGSAGADPVVEQAMGDMKRMLVDITKSSLDEGIRCGCVRPLNSTVVSEVIVGMIYHIAFERFVLGRDMDVSTEALAEEIVDFELRGLLAESE